MVNPGRCAVRFLMVAALGLLIGCGGGGGGDGDDGCPDGEVGDYDVAINITAGCAASVLGVWTADYEFLPPNEIRLYLYLPETPACCPETLALRGVENAPNSYLIDDVPERFICALNDQYGYEMIGIDDAVLVQTGVNFDLTGDVSVIAGAACTGTITIHGTPRP